MIPNQTDPPQRAKTREERIRELVETTSLDERRAAFAVDLADGRTRGDLGDDDPTCPQCGYTRGYVLCDRPDCPFGGDPDYGAGPPEPLAGAQAPHSTIPVPTSQGTRERE
jgi:hypothetical protein